MRFHGLPLRRHARCLAAFLLGCTLFATGPTASARRPQPSVAARHFRRGNQAFRKGAYQRALVEYETAAECWPTLALLYNLAQTYRRLGQSKRALELYERFLAARPMGRGSEEARYHIARLTRFFSGYRSP